MPPNAALEAALALSRRPSLAAAMRAQALPEGAGMLLRLLAGDVEALAEGRRLSNMHGRDLKPIVETYVLQVMLFQGAAARRVLAADAAAGRPEMRAHMRDLLSWLHPDKSDNPWHAPFAARVIEAWRQIDRGTDEPSPPRLRMRAQRVVRVPWILLPAERPQARWGRVHWKLIGALLCSLLIAAGIALSDETVHGIAQAAFAPKLFVAPSVEPILVKASRIARNPPKSTPNSPKPKDLK